MLVLRSLLTTNIVAQLALNPTSPREAAMKGLSLGIFQYLNLQKTILALPTGISTGIIATPIPSPGFSLVSASIAIQSSDILYQKLLDYTKTNIGTINPLSHKGIFKAIQEYLEMHLVTINPTGLPLTAGAGVGTIKFPIMSLLGITCWSTMVGMGVVGAFSLDPTIGVIDKQYEILSNFIYIGLNYNLIAPILTTGTIGSAYTGLSTFLWFFIDVPDWPVGSATGVSSILSTLGLTTTEDLSSLSYEPQEETSVLTTDCTSVDTELLTSAFGSSANNSPYTATGGSLCSQIDSVNNSLVTDGMTSAATLSSSLVGDIGTPSYIDTSVGSFNVATLKYNMRLFSPTIKLNLRTNKEILKQNLARTGRI